MIAKLNKWEALLLAIGGGLLVQLIWHHSKWNQTWQHPKQQTGGRRDEWIYQEQLSQGIPGTYQTLAAMRALVRRDAADPAIRNFAVDLVSHIRGHDFLAEVKTLFEFIRDGITYRRDPVTVERVQDTRRTIFQFGSGDCDDKVVALASLLGALGHKSRFVVLGYSSDNFAHVYLEVWTGLDWLPLDPTNEHAQPGWEARGVMRQSYSIFD